MRNQIEWQRLDADEARRVLAEHMSESRRRVLDTFGIVAFETPTDRYRVSVPVQGNGRRAPVVDRMRGANG